MVSGEKVVWREGGESVTCELSRVVQHGCEDSVNTTDLMELSHCQSLSQSWLDTKVQGSVLDIKLQGGSVLVHSHRLCKLKVKAQLTSLTTHTGSMFKTNHSLQDYPYNLDMINGYKIKTFFNSFFSIERPLSDELLD